jgi:hypothetical protein
MSKLETNTIDTVSGTSNLVIGSTNTSTITMPNGALSGQNYPAFNVSRSVNQNLTENTATKVQLDNVTLDTDSAYDNSTNYRFTIPSGKSGKYFIVARCTMQGLNSAAKINIANTLIYKNGSAIASGYVNAGGTAYFDYVSGTASVIVSLSTGDYIEMYQHCDTASSTPTVRGDDFFTGVTNMQGYRIGA